jgi:DNA-binding NarL/FixJ family response regulator
MEIPSASALGIVLLISQHGKSTMPSQEGNIIRLEMLNLCELQVLELVAHGSYNQQIGQLLTRSLKTIARQRERMR